jgi:dihydroflavonol-4-reductase
MTQTVLLTGVSGYIGLHCAAQALRAGFRVRGSVRDIAKQQEVRETLISAETDPDMLEFVELNLTSDEGWDVAMEGCTYVLHVASPFVIANPKNEDDMLVPAVEGTVRVLRAAKHAGVARVVFTSTALAMFGSMKKGTFGPEDWTDVTTPNVSTYTKSKTLAERAAWDFMADQLGESTMELVVINPGGVFGPPLGNNLSGQSMTMLDDMLRGKVPMVPNAGFPMVDVRDVATLHVRAMTLPEAKGQRFIVADHNPFSFSKIAKTLNDAGHKGPSARIAPDLLLRFMAFLDREAKGMIGFLGMDLKADNRKTRDMFDWTPFPLEQSVRESAEAVLALQTSD